MSTKGSKTKNNNTVPTLAEYITNKINNRISSAYSNSLSRTKPRVPNISIIGERYNPISKQVEPVYEQGPSCAYTFSDNYGQNWMGSEDFRQNHNKYGFKQINWKDRQAGDAVLTIGYDDKAKHTMMYDSDNSEGIPLYNHSNGGKDESAIRKKAKFPVAPQDRLIYRFVGTPADSVQWTNEYKQIYGNQMKCGGRRKAQLGLDIREGGIAIPIAPNMYYMNGRSHDEGGIGIGPNNKNGLEVEGGEVVKVGDKDIKVFSSVPLLRGVSPAQLVMGGANPNKVFKAQEEFKDRNHINDDGTRYQTGGQKIYTPNKSIQRQIQETGKITIGGAPTIGGLRTFSYLRGLANTKKYGNIATNVFRVGKELIKRSTQKLVDSGKITKEVAQAPRSIYGQFIGGYGQNLPKTFNLLIDNNQEMKAGGIYIKPSKRGTFTAAAKKRGMGVQEFASKVLANKEDYSPAMVKKANFARNASRWKKELGGNMIYTVNGNIKNGLMSARPKAKHGKTLKIDLNKVKMPTFDISQLGSKERRTYKANIPKSGRWVGQYKSTNAGDWIGLGSNLAGTVASYFMTKNAINKMPYPIKPVMAQAAKLKTRYNVEPQLTNIREAEQTNRAAVRRNTQSSSTSLAREQRLLNEARGAKNVLYGQKENIETQLINQDRLNRQTVMMENVNRYNDYLNRLTGTRQAKNQLRISNINNLLSGLTGSVNNILGTIESRRATNNTLRAIAAANPNVDARLIGGFDYYIDPVTKRKYNKNQQYVGTING